MTDQHNFPPETKPWPPYGRDPRDAHFTEQQHAAKEWCYKELVEIIVNPSKKNSEDLTKLKGINLMIKLHKLI